MEKNEKTISRKELREKLRIKTDRTIEVYIKEGSLPQPVKEIEGDLLFDKEEILKMLGAESLEENFINAEEVSKIIDLPKKRVNSLAGKGLIPSYRLNNVRGSQILFLASEVEAAKQFTIAWSASFGNRLIREVAAKSILSELASKKIGLLTERSSDVFLEIMINGKTIQEVGEMFSLTPNRIKMIFENSVKRLASRVGSTNLILENDRQRNSELAELRKTVEHYKEKEKRLATLSSEQRELLGTELRKFDFSARVLNTFRAVDMETVADLVRHTKSDLLKYRNWGKKSLGEVEEFLMLKGLSLGMKI